MHTKKMFDLTGRVAIITGGYKGLGLVFAEALAEMGANIVICGRKIEKYQEDLKGLNISPSRMLAVKCDVWGPLAVQRLVDKTVEKFGRIDILVNNAGTSWRSPPEIMALKDWQRVIDTNLT